MKSLLNIWLFLFCEILFGQTTQIGLSYTNSFPVYELNAAAPLRNPWTGGMNAVKVNQLDLNNDGSNDLLITDRTGNSILTFEKQGISQSWIFNPELKKSLPPIQDWVVVKDYNLDGKPDIFSSSVNGIRVYQNKGYINNTLDWELVTPLILSDYGQSNLNLFVSRVDIPGIEDIDNDGDLDILTFYILGTCVEYHRNMSIEQYGHADSLVYRLESDNWGVFTENATSNSIQLNDSCGRFADGERHAGSTLLPYDLDNDGDKDLILGDVSYSEALFLINEPQNGRDIIINTPATYPMAWNSVGIPVFPTLSAIQANNDSLPDLIIGANTDNQSRNSGRTLLMFRGEPGNFHFTGGETPFLSDEMLDFGRNSFPHLCDLDNDGDQDLLVGSGGRFIPSNQPGEEGNYLASIALFENTGNQNAPEFRLRQTDLASLSTLNAQHLAPACADLNGDGRKDMILGLADGRFRIYFQNNGPIPFQFNTTNAIELQSDAGELATPLLYDLNADGLYDIISGSRQGDFKVFYNQGSTSAPAFSGSPNITGFGNAETIEEGVSNNGFSSPGLISMNGNIQLISGSARGSFFLWPNPLNTQNLGIPDSLISFIDEGRNTSVSTADLNADGFPDFISGNGRGGLTAYLGGIPTSTTNIEQQVVKLFPNPAKSHFNIQLPYSINNNKLTILISSVTGTIVKALPWDGLPIHCENLAPGVYAVTLINSDGQTLFTQKLLKLNQ